MYNVWICNCRYISNSIECCVNPVSEFSRLHVDTCEYYVHTYVCMCIMFFLLATMPGKSHLSEHTYLRRLGRIILTGPVATILGTL